MRNAAFVRDPRPSRRRALIFLFLALLLSAPRSQAQCSLCRDAVSSADPKTREAMNYAIVGLAFAPYGIGAFAAFVVSPKLRRHVRERLGAFRKKKTGDFL